MTTGDHHKALEAQREQGALAKRLRKKLFVWKDVRKLLTEAMEKDSTYLQCEWVIEHGDDVARTVGELSSLERKKLIKLLLPKLTDTVEAAWQALEQRPHTTGEYRRPFRCPISDGLAELRGGWLLRVAAILGDYDADPVWVATWAAHLMSWYTHDDLGWLLAGALNRGDKTAAEVLEILKASTTGDHEIAEMSEHVPVALMASSRADAWEFNEKLLLAAQRQEGLRQSILESVDESHPEAFRRMLRLILEHNLSRFSSVVRAFDTWFGFAWDGSSGMKVDEVLTKVLRFFDEPGERAVALQGEDAETAYLALWTFGFEDVETSIPHAVALLEHHKIEMRFVATHFLAQTGWGAAIAPLSSMIEDDDLRVAARAVFAMPDKESHWVDASRLFARCEALLGRLTKRSVKLESIVWPWWTIELTKPLVAEVMSVHSATERPDRMLPHVKDLDPDSRGAFVRRLAGLNHRWAAEKKAPKALEGKALDTVLALLGDASLEVREAAFEAIENTPAQPKETQHLIKLLSRKAGDLRIRCIRRISLLPDADMLDVASRLLQDKSKPRQVAGLELLRGAVEAERSVDEARRIAREHDAAHEVESPEERAHIEAITGSAPEPVELDTALGLVDAARLPVWGRPEPKSFELETEAAANCIDAIARIAIEHQDLEVNDMYGNRVLLSEIGSRLRGPRDTHGQEDLSVADNEAQLPLAEIWRLWNTERGPETRDPDGLELVRASMVSTESSAWNGEFVSRLRPGSEYSSGVGFVRTILSWCLYWRPPKRAVEFVLDVFENVLSKLTDDDLEEMKGHGGRYVRTWADDKKPYERRAQVADNCHRHVLRLRALLPDAATRDDSRRVYALLRWYHLESRCYGYIAPRLFDFVQAYEAGAFGDAAADEFADLLVGRVSHLSGSDMFRHVSGVKPHDALVPHPELQEVIARCRRKVVEVETQRGDRATAASTAVRYLRWSGGFETMRPAIEALGSTGFARTQSYWLVDESSRKDTLSLLVLRSVPGKNDTPEVFAEWVEEAGIKQKRLVELAAYAPLWASYVAHVLGWPGFESAIWWFHAHTKDERWDVRDLRDLWEAQVSERTPLSAQDLTEGAVDVEWFHNVHRELGAERWKALHKAAKYASSAGGHKRAQLFAEAMSGEISCDDLLKRIDDKRHQDAVRALGLVPLATGKKRGKDLLDRYQRLQDFKRESRKFGSQRQASEGRAVTIGMENLARTAGFKDPLRLQWAMEMQAVRDLAQGPVTLAKDDIRIELSIDSDGQPELGVRKGERSLKSVPAKLRKDADVVELKGRLKELRRQASRVRGALEEAMCRGDVFEGEELQRLMGHPILAPSLSRLVFVGEDIRGYPVHGGKALEDAEGKVEPVLKEERLRIAHPDDLLARGEWSRWQRECLRSERMQPFKQVFRELYPMTETERSDKLRSQRFAGHQVNPRQALALLGSRGWVAQPEEGVSKTYHAEGLTARLGFEESFYTPAEIEGLTLEFVAFTKKGELTYLDLATLPPRLFSETMRDLDLVVSVAHQGGVDPEASASTIEMRASLLRETCTLLELDNVEVKESNAIIRGQRGDYSIHLGSAQARMLGGYALAIVAVPSQHRGRLFLPFADDDPRTAEVLSKVLLLARDKEIKDPALLDQIRGG